MSAPLLEKAPAKINLTLRVLSRRSDGYHELESLVAFADIADTLTLQPDTEDSLEIGGPFAGKSGVIADNLVLKARAALKDRITDVRGGLFRLEKNIPVAAGLGGGSADAAAALRLVARASNIAFDDPRLMSAALAVGADVPVCVASRARVMRGVGELLSEPIDLPVLPAVLVNPRETLATRDVFGKFTGSLDRNRIADVPREFEAFVEFLKRQDNDLTPAATACAPVVGEMLRILQTLPGVELARMSGSGPTCFALFGSQGDAIIAARRLGDQQKNWWVRPTMIGSASANS